MKNKDTVAKNRLRRRIGGGLPALLSIVISLIFLPQTLLAADDQFDILRDKYTQYLLGEPSGAASIESFDTIDDAYIRSGTNGDTTYGTLPYLYLKEASGDYGRQSFLKFDINNLAYFDATSGIAPCEVENSQNIAQACSQVSRAKLKLYVKSIGGNPHSVSAYKVADDTWNENTLTWNNAPTIGNIAASLHINGVDSYYEWDLTAYVNEELNNDSLVSISLKNDIADDWTHLSTHEDVNSPQLELTFITANVLGNPDDATVANYINTMNVDKVWDDLIASSDPSSPDYDDRSLGLMFTRVNEMTFAWANENSDYYQNPTLVADVITGLTWLNTNRYSEQIAPTGNWWGWDIGIPHALLPTLALLFDNLPANQLANYVAAITYYNPVLTRTGANLVDEAYAVILKGILEKNGAEISRGSEALSPVFDYVLPGEEGMYPDGTFMFHKKIPYNLSYGAPLLNSLIRSLWLVDGTEWDNVDPKRVNVTSWIINSFEPFLLDGKLALPLTGRASSRKSLNERYGSTYNALIQAIYLFSELNWNTEADHMQSMVKDELSQNFTFDKVSHFYQQKFQALLADINISAVNVADGNYHLYMGDIMAHKKSDWYFINKMHSTRTYAYENVNLEDKQASFKSDGAYYLYTHPKDYLNNWMFAVDNNRIPGITTERLATKPQIKTWNPWGNPSTGPIGITDFVGGVSLAKEFGVASMDLEQHDVDETSGLSLSAKKSWFMFDNEVVALGTSIKSLSGRTVETIIDNRILSSGGTDTLTIDGAQPAATLGWSDTINTNWMHLEYFGGYYFPGSATIKGLREHRTADTIETSSQTDSDLFTEATLSSVWSWIREDKNNHTYVPGKLSFSTQQGTLKSQINTTQNLVIKEPMQGVDFEVTTQMTFSPMLNEQEAGLIVYLDDDNFISISRSLVNMAPVLITSHENNGVNSENSVIDTFGNIIYLKIQKSGNQWSLFASDNNSSWGTAIEVITRYLTSSNGINYNVGFFGQNGQNGTVSENVDFAYLDLKHAGDFMTLWFDHGTTPVDASYQYVLLPNMIEADVSSYAASPDITVLENSAQAQAVSDDNLGLVGATFWADTTKTVNWNATAWLTSDSKASVMTQSSIAEIKVAVSDPTQQNLGSINLEINTDAKYMLSGDSNVSITQLSLPIKMSADVGGLYGKSTQVAFGYGALPNAEAPLWNNDLLESTNTTIAWYHSKGAQGYTISYGTSPGVYTDTVNVGLTGRHNLIDLETDKMYYFVIQASNTNGKSLYSTELSKFVKAIYSPKGDTYIQGGDSKDYNFGRSQDIALKTTNSSTGAYERIGYYKFDLTNELADITSVASAKIGLSFSSVSPAQPISLYGSADNWDEMLITWNNAPAIDTQLSTVAVASTNMYYEWDITAYVNAQLASDRVVSIVLKADIVGKWASSVSKEGVNKPYLEIKKH